MRTFSASVHAGMLEKQIQNIDVLKGHDFKLQKAGRLIQTAFDHSHRVTVAGIVNRFFVL